MRTSSQGPIRSRLRRSSSHERKKSHTARWYARRVFGFRISAAKNSMNRMWLSIVTPVQRSGRLSDCLSILSVWSIEGNPQFSLDKVNYDREGKGIGARLLGTGEIPGVMTPTAFEQQIHRIIELLEGSGAEVTWNDHIPDPDNPLQLRQIDITIRRDGKLTICECRLSQRRQDVKWIEELIGRRKSLGAHAVIAVSSSGFTKGALKKGPPHQVTLRDLQSLSAGDVATWGQHVALTLYYYQYSNLMLRLVFASSSLPNIDPAVLRSQFNGSDALQSTLFNTAAEYIDGAGLLPDERFGQEVKFSVHLALLDVLHLCGETVTEMALQGTVCLVSKPVSLHAVQAYRNPTSPLDARLATVERFSLGDTSVVHEEDRISVFLDVSQMGMPPLSQFGFSAH